MEALTRGTSTTVLRLLKEPEATWLTMRIMPQIIFAFLQCRVGIGNEAAFRRESREKLARRDTPQGVPR